MALSKLLAPTPASDSVRDHPHSLPRDTEEGRALLQHRLAQLGRIAASLSGLFSLVGMLVGYGMHVPGAGATTVANLLGLAASLTVWRIARGKQLPVPRLLVLDALASWICAAPFVALTVALPLWARPELISLFAVTDILVLRAFLIPSTGRRTALIGLLPVSCVVALTYVVYNTKRWHPEAPDAATYALVAATLGLYTLMLHALTSRTIFGLREQARQAFQLGQYTLLEKLGEGGMGVVYKASHATLRRPTAIKLLPAERAGEHNLARFEREVQLTSQLTHPNTIAIYDYGRTADGILYYAMEYLDGLDLESLVTLAGPLPAGRVVPILVQVCGALAEAHESGLIHRDVKPGNVLLCRRGGRHDVAKVLDFGLVKELHAPQELGLSAMDQFIGTPLYMSPEAISRPSTVDARSDLYALGAVAYFLLTGKPPFSGATVLAVCAHHLQTPPTPLSERLHGAISAELDQLILSCLAKLPEQRPRSAAQLATQLLACPESAWTNEQASAWWAAHTVAIEQHRALASASGTDGATVAVDLRSRAEPTAVWQSGG